MPCSYAAHWHDANRAGLRLPRRSREPPLATPLPVCHQPRPPGSPSGVSQFGRSRRCQETGPPARGKPCAGSGKLARYSRQMAVLIRTLMICLLTLAMPVQGIAAVTMALCGLMHHGTVAATSAHHAAMPPHMPHGLDVAMTHQHVSAGAHAPATEAPDESSDLDELAAPPVDAADTHACNVCGSCCSTGAISGSVPSLPAMEAASSPWAAVVVAVDPFVAEGPDRPPRTPFV